MPDTATGAASKEFEVATRRGRKIVMRELNGLEQVESDRLAGNRFALGQYRTMNAIVSVDGIARPKFSNAIDVKAYMQKLKGSDGDFAMQEYAKRYITKSDAIQYTLDGDTVTVTCKPSGMIVKLDEMDYRAQTSADRLANSVWAMDAYRTVFAIKSINGQQVASFTSKEDANARLEALPGHVVEQCAYAYQKAFAASADDLGNESEPDDFPQNSSVTGPESVEPSLNP